MEEEKLKKTLKGYLLGFLSAALLVGCITAFAANTTTLYDVIANGVKIVVDGHKLNPTDANGNKVEPIIYNGTTYLPVRAVANALGKAVYWDGPNYTVYLGQAPTPGGLPYPTEELNVSDNIGDYFWDVSHDLKDNYGNYYSRAIDCDFGNLSYDTTFEKICNMKFSKIKGTIYVENGSTLDEDVQILIKADGKTIYTSPALNKRTAPVDFNVDITGCNILQIVQTKRTSDIHIGDAGFYQ